jgi:hypothetical protein
MPRLFGYNEFCQRNDSKALLVTGDEIRRLVTPHKELATAPAASRKEIGFALEEQR